MNGVRKRRLYLVIILGLCSFCAALLVMSALRANINLFFTPTQIMAGAAPQGARIRVGGLVEKGSIVRSENLQVTFVVTDLANRLTIKYAGILPDLFREGQGIVALGTLTDSNQFYAQEILAKHDENYRPPEIKELP